MAFYVYKKRKTKLIQRRSQRSTIVPMVLFFFGLFILGYISYPYASFYLAQTFKIDNLSKELLSPQDNFKVYAENNPDASNDYDKNAAQNIAEINKEIESGKLGEDLSNIKGKMYITIDKLGLKKVPININTNSASESDYNSILSSNVAHFKGTSLPGHPGKTFLYGHSYGGLFSGGARSFGTGIFTDIDQLNLGDEFSVDFQDQTFKYTVYKVKLVKKDDLSVIFGDSRKTLSLMTCKPNGIGQMRLIVDAIQDV